MLKKHLGIDGFRNLTIEPVRSGLGVADDLFDGETIRVIHKGFCIWTSCPLAPTAVNIVL